MERYYSPQRPVEPGSYPKPADNKVLNIENFDERKIVPEFGWPAWGYIEYESPLSEKDAAQYELISSGNSVEQAQFITDCSSLLDEMEKIYTNSDISANMPPEQINRRLEDNGFLNLLDNYKDKPGFNIDLLEDGGIQIQCPSTEKYEKISNRETKTGQFAFGSSGSMYADLEPTKATKYIAEVFHASNTRETDEAIKHFNQATLYQHNRIDVYYLSDKENEHVHGSEIYENALWAWHSDQDFTDLILGFIGEDKNFPAEEFRCIGYDQISLDGTHNKFYYLPPSDSWDVKANINYLEKGNCPIYFHPVRLEYERGKDEHTVSRFTYIDNFKVDSEYDLNPFDDRYLNNELPAISIAVPYASELSKLPHEEDVLTVLCTEPSDLHRAVEELLSSVRPHAWEQAEQIQQRMGKDETDDFPLNKPEIEAEPDGHGAR